MTTNRFRAATDQQISDAIESGLTTIFKELQDAMGVTCGGVAGEYDMGYHAHDIRQKLDEYFSDYVDRERLYAPDDMIYVPIAPEGYGSPYSDPNFLDAARTVEAHHAYMLTMGFGLDGSDDYGLFNRKAGSPDEMVAKLSITVPNRHTHAMTVEFEPGTPNVIHISLEPLAEIEIPWDLEEEVEDEGHGAFCD